MCNFGGAERSLYINMYTNPFIAQQQYFNPALKIICAVLNCPVVHEESSQPLLAHKLTINLTTFTWQLPVYLFGDLATLTFNCYNI